MPTQQRTYKVKTASNIIDYELETSNMYGCQPCPKCGSKFRWCQNDPISKLILCDDCGYSEKAFNDLIVSEGE